MRKTVSSLIVVLLLGLAVLAQTPVPPLSVTYVSNSSGPNLAPVNLTSSGGTISVYNLESTTQNPRWKAYVGNITGKLSLSDAASKSLFDWNIAITTGEIYATRNSSSVSWENIACASNANVAAEQQALNHNHTAEDNINRTFNQTNHNAFYVGITPISANSCKTVHLNVNNTFQTTRWGEVLLYDGNTMLYTGLIENNAIGFNNQTYDYQLLLAENAAEGNQPATPYYFYIELV